MLAPTSLKGQVNAMFIYSIRASTIKLAAVIGAAAVALGVIVAAAPNYEVKTTAAIAAAKAEYRYDKVKTNDDRVAFLRQFGWETDGEVLEEVTMKIPREFDRIMTSYNEIQKQSGLDLSKYRGREVTRYTYAISNYPSYDGRVNANIIVYNSRVIGGDISSSDVSGFISTFEYPSEGALTDSAENSSSTEQPPSSGSATGASAEKAQVGES